MVDYLVIPKGLKPGEYVLGFRWDCEETSQVKTAYECVVR